MRQTDLPYLGGAVSAAAYAYWLEQRERKYHPDVTWLNVTGGVVLTGLWVAVRYAMERQPRPLSWAWWVVFRMFVATGIPVVAWEELARGARWRRLLNYLRGRHGYPATTARVSSGAAGRYRN